MTLTKKDKEEIVEIVNTAVLEAMQGHDSLGDLDPDSLEAQAKRWNEGGIKSESTGLIVAPDDLYIIDEDGERQTEFDCDEADDLIAKLPDGWRLPTHQELLKIGVEFCFDDDGKIIGDASKTVFGKDGYWWSATADSATNRYYLYYGSSSTQFSSYSTSRYLGIFVRCVRTS